MMVLVVGWMWTEDENVVATDTVDGGAQCTSSAEAVLNEGA